MLLLFFADTLSAQTSHFRELHKVKRRETIFGIARSYGITIDELIKANPEMSTPGYELKKGSYVTIPWPASVESKSATNNVASTGEIAMPSKPVAVVSDMRTREIRVGVMLPLHTINGDGRRMLEYYRGVLMACDSLRANGISTDIRAWNVAEDSDISTFLQDEHAADRDVIIGPLYSKQVKALSDFATEHDIRVLIPFSINSHELYTNRNIFQVYQSPVEQNEAFVRTFVTRFADSHPVFVDCNDTTSQKGIFTSGLRRRLEQQDIKYSITNIKSGDAMFTKAFSTTQRNVVILNTGRSQELNIVMSKLNSLAMSHPELKITLFGYTDWMLYTRHQLENFYKFDTYIPATFYMNPQSPRTNRINLKYRWNFHTDMIPSCLPRMGITGFDHAYFFIKGLHLYGKQFTGASGMVGYTPIQTPLHFERIGNGGLQNRSVLFVHYMPSHKTETIFF